MFIGFAWAILWYIWFRDEPADHQGVGPEELELIHATRHPRSIEDFAENSPQPRFARSELWLLSGQYFASNFTFFFCLTWLFPHLNEKFSLSGVEAGFYAATPLIAGAVGNWVSGFLVDAIFRRGRWTASRRNPAMLGFTLAAIGLVGGAASDTALSSIAWFSLAIFGADMTLAPSWSVCIDIGRKHAGAVSGTMNMAGNLGSFVTALAFPYLAAWTESNQPFFYLAAGLNAAALFAWMSIDPRREAGDGT
jgi:ACS family glucarate transporter-like MFS transporter